MVNKRIFWFSMLFILIIALSACGESEPPPVEEAPPAEAPIVEQPQEEVEIQPESEPEAEVQEVMVDFTLPEELLRTLEDSDSSLRASENRTLGTDKFLDNLYERPFTSQEMIYQPELDIITTDFGEDDSTFFFTIHLYGQNLQEWGLTGTYGIEFDRSLNGRGDLLVLANGFDEDWSAEGVMIYTDANRDVGGPQPMVADENFSGTGYDTLVLADGENFAFARRDPEDDNGVQFAISKTILEDPEEFLWGAWAIGDINAFSVDKFDFNDTMGPGEAGSPLRDNPDYPIQNLYSMDNTCRLPYGFEQVGFYPGMCIIGVQAKAPKGDDSCTPYCVRPCITHVGCCEWGCR